MLSDDRLAATADRLTRSTPWEQVGELRLRFDAGHPQGMVRIGDSWWISTVDLTTGSGSVLIVDGSGDQVGRTPVGDTTRFHPGGMDFDGEALWVASSEYRPRSTAVVERLVPDGDSVPELHFRHDDHVGAISRLGPKGDFVGWTWGSRRLLRWQGDGRVVDEVRLPGHFVDYQDAQWLGGDLLLCGGVATVQLAQGPGSLGGLGLLRASDLVMEREVPFPHYAPSGRAATQNPLFAEIVDDAMVIHLLPDDGQGAILSYATPVASPTAQGRGGLPTAHRRTGSMTEPEPEHVASARAVYDATADRYATAVGTEVNSTFEGPIDRALLSAFAEALETTPGPVADVGCGPGRVAAFLASRGIEVSGVDVSPSMLVIARHSHPNIRFDEGQLDKLPYADASLAGAVYWYSIINTPPTQLVEVFVEAGRVLARSGQVLVAFQAGDGGLVHRADIHGTGLTLTNYRHSPDDVARAVTEAGLHVQATTIRDAQLAHETTPQAFLLARKGPASAG